MNITLDQQNIINILGIESLPDERKAALVEQMSELVQKRLLVRILDSLTEAKRQEFENILDSTDQEKMNSFLAENTPEMGQWLVEEVNNLKQELAGLVPKEA